MGFLVRTFSWPIIVGASWIKNQRLNSSKIFHLVLDDESIELFDHSKSAVGFKTTQIFDFRTKDSGDVIGD